MYGLDQFLLESLSLAYRAPAIILIPLEVHTPCVPRMGSDRFMLCSYTICFYGVSKPYREMEVSQSLYVWLLSLHSWIGLQSRLMLSAHIRSLFLIKKEMIDLSRGKNVSGGGGIMRHIYYM